jgi:MSHA biogenesis protein MshP
MSVKQTGASMILALFLIVTLAGVGGFLVSIYTVQQQTTTQDELAQRAYQSARAGLQWGAYQLLRQSGGAFTLACDAGSTTQTISFTAASGNLSGFSVRVTCTSFGSQVEGAETVRSYRVVARGCNQANCAAPTLGPFYVERELQATVAN